MTSQDWLAKDFYATLGVPKDADASVIKKAYRKRASAMHPDANPDDPSAEDRFKNLGEAYAVLSDPEQRQQYDALRAMTAGGARFSAGSQAGGAGFEDLLGGMFGGGGGRVRFSNMGGGGAANISIEDLLSGFGGGGGGGFGNPAGPPRATGRDLAASTTLTFREAIAGANVSVKVAGRTVNARVPAGVHNGQKIRLRGKGEASRLGGPPGDIIITVAVTPHPIFTADAANLRLTLPVTFAEAALGARINVPLLDGGEVAVKVPSGTPSGRVLRVKGRGLELAGKRGDLLVTIQVAVPERLPKAAKAAVEAFAEATKDLDPRADLLEQAQA